MKAFLTILALCFANFQSFAPPTIRDATVGTFNRATVSGGGGSLTFITAVSGGSARHDFTGTVGFSFTPAQNITVTDLGRYVVSGDVGAHVVYLVNSSCSILASVTVNTSGATAGTFVYDSITPTSLTSGNSYSVLSTETLNGDDFLNDNSTVTTTSDGTITRSTFSTTSPVTCNSGTTGVKAYGPTNCKYTVP